MKYYELIKITFHENTVPVESLDTPTHSRAFLYFHYFLHCRIIMKTSKNYEKTHMESCSSPQKVFNKSKYVLDFLDLDLDVLDVLDSSK